MGRVQGNAVDRIPTYSETSNISHLPNFHTSTNSSVFRAPYLTIGKPLSKFHTSYSFLFQGIGRVLVLANAYPRKISVEIGLKKKKCREKTEGKEEDKQPYLHES